MKLLLSVTLSLGVFQIVHAQNLMHASFCPSQCNFQLNRFTLSPAQFAVVMKKTNEMNVLCSTSENSYELGCISKNGDQLSMAQVVAVRQVIIDAAGLSCP